MSIRFDGRVVIVTGAGNGLGRSHALALASRGAKVVINDIGSSVNGSGVSTEAAMAVVEEIVSQGGEAIANAADITDREQVADMVGRTLDKWGRVDILVNNAGILRDKSFANMSLDDFEKVVNVHLIGAANCTKAVWACMREQGYGRVAMTTSSSGLYGNFGQANYSAAKMALVGLMNTLHLEGAKYNIRVNTLSPAGATRMMQGLVSEEVANLLPVSSVTQALIYLVSENAPSRLILCAGAGGYAATRIYETEGIFLEGDRQTPENIAEAIGDILDPTHQKLLLHSSEQTEKFLKKASGKNFKLAAE